MGEWLKYLIVLLILISCNTEEYEVNLVPDKPAKAPNYWCTWYAQNYWQQRGGEITDFEAINNPNAREELTYPHLFNRQDGWVTNYLPRGRSDWFFLIDHGWQTKNDSERIVAGAEPFFSLQIDTTDFPNYRQTEPKESLRQFNQEVKTYKWRGLGLWVRGNIPRDAAQKFVEWSKYAEIEYWKIDGGDTDEFFCYEIKKSIYPGLMLEYVTGSNGPLNPNWDQKDLKQYPSVYIPGGSKNEFMLKVLKNTDVFRTYDAAPILVTTTTLRRTHDILEQTQNNRDYVGILNLQDDPQAAAGLGCLVASKRHPNYMERTYQGEDFHHQIRGKRMIQKRMNEIERFGRWQRIAPAFSAGIGTYRASEQDLIDYYIHTKNDTWFKPCWDKMVYQSAPAVMARNMPLPQVKVKTEAPYVMASTYPNGPICIATEGRVKPDNQWFHPRAKVTVQIKDAQQLIGIFGHYEELVLQFDTSIGSNLTVRAQDLLAEKAIDITRRISITGKEISIPGDLIDQIGTSAGDEGDISVPGLVLKIDEN